MSFIARFDGGSASIRTLRAAAARLSADVFEDGHLVRLDGRVLRAACILRHDVVVGVAAGDFPRCSSMAAIGFNVMHDGGHRAYSNHRWINRLMAMALDLLGGSSHGWARKHNVIHHSFANITGHDDDIDIGILGRLSPHQRRLPFHRLQHYYLWGLYGFLPVNSVFL